MSETMESPKSINLGVVISFDKYVTFKFCIFQVLINLVL